MNLSETLNAVNNMSPDELNSVIDAIKARRYSLQVAKKNSFSIGDKVSFMYKNVKRTGTITKLLKKNVRVFTMGSEWNITPSLLTAI